MEYHSLELTLSTNILRMLLTSRAYEYAELQIHAIRFETCFWSRRSVFEKKRSVCEAVESMVSKKSGILPIPLEAMQTPYASDRRV